jgi:uncharacterized protein YndB with AHSA1/START domain
MKLRHVAALIALLPFGAQARIVDSKPSGFTTENTITVPVDVTRAWEAVVEDVDDWWPKEHSWFGKEGRFRIEPRAGGCFCEKSGKREALHMTVSFVDPGSLLRLLGGLGPLQGLGLHGAMEFRFEAVEGGTKVTLHYVAGGYTTQDLVKFAPIVDQVQGLQLGGLEKYLKPAP